MRLCVVLLFALITQTSVTGEEDPESFLVPSQLEDDESQQLTEPDWRLRNSLQMNKPVRLLDAIIQNFPIPQLFQDTDPITPNSTTQAPPTTVAPDLDAEVCSGRPFSTFTQLGNGSIYAFRGKYVFELSQKSVLPGYPKLIQDVWGMPGPIDAAFTRFNCERKTYIFKDNQFWRFNQKGVLDRGYPRAINVGFDKVLYPFDAVFAMPFLGKHSKEKLFIFKGEEYYSYNFVHRPICGSASDDDSEDLLSEPSPPGHSHKYHFIDKDWKGLKSPLDAALAGRVFQTSWRSFQGNQAEQHYEPDAGQEMIDIDQDLGFSLRTVYFFRADKYYRVDLASKRVEPASPAYPRSIAKYWLGCTNMTGAP